MHQLLIYHTAPDYLQRRGEYRSAHLDLAKAAVARGELVVGGAVGNPPESALLLFNGETPAHATAFAKADPYVLNGLVTGWEVKPWNTVVGLSDLVPDPL
ncbi:YciI-like protein [Herbaspirillum lusitanum]|uniref:YciI-like protein n=1 Tax=Herbaspirillum lusitanum TaxID=213312 RepID=A0ABW9AA63_9BURK